MTMWKCWCFSEGESEDDATEVSDTDLVFANADAEDAAEEACRQWESRGRWSGDPIPNVTTVHVRDPDGVLWEVEVEPSYSVDFFGGTPRKLETTT